MTRGQLRLRFFFGARKTGQNSLFLKTRFGKSGKNRSRPKSPKKGLFSINPYGNAQKTARFPAARKAHRKIHLLRGPRGPPFLGSKKRQGLRKFIICKFPTRPTGVDRAPYRLVPTRGLRITPTKEVSKCARISSISVPEKPQTLNFWRKSRRPRNLGPQISRPRDFRGSTPKIPGPGAWLVEKIMDTIFYLPRPAPSPGTFNANSQNSYRLARMNHRSFSPSIPSDTQL